MIAGSSVSAGYAFASPADAVEAMVRRWMPVAAERVPLEEAYGRVLAEPVVADRPSPAIDVSAMDGYAVRLGALTTGRHHVRGDVMIGREPPAMPREGVLRIVTGAPLPAGADAVLRREDVQEENETIVVPPGTLGAAAPGSHIRRSGENVGAGAAVLGRGREIDAAAAGAMAAFGAARPLVYRVVRVGVLVTGDEVLGAADDPSPWQLRDSNGAALGALLSGRRWLEPLPVRRSPDERPALAEAVGDLLGRCDALLITGGVSMGDRDFVPGVLADLGAEILFHRLPQRPGKPVFGAIARAGVPVLALPGNPVSVMVTARRMGVAVLARLAGLDRLPPAPLVTVTNADAARLDLWWQRPVRVTEGGSAELVGTRGSGDVASTATSDGFVEMPPGGGGPGPWPFYRWRL